MPMWRLNAQSGTLTAARLGTRPEHPPRGQVDQALFVLEYSHYPLARFSSCSSAATLGSSFRRLKAADNTAAGWPVS